MRKLSAKSAPMPTFIQPCLASLSGEIPQSAQWAHEIKFDGYRVQARIDNGEVRLLTRSGLDWTDKFGSLTEALLTFDVTTAIIDGEVVVLDDEGASSFASLVSDLKTRRTARMVYYAFDLLFLDGADTRTMPLMDRKRLLKRLFARCKRSGRVRFSDHVQGKGGTMFAQACKLGLEGIVCKRLDKPYRSGRGVNWLKVKCVHTDEFVVGGYLNSKAMNDAIGALVVGHYDGKRLIYAGRVGTGFSRRIARELKAQLHLLRRETSPFSAVIDQAKAAGVVWVKPRLVAQVDYRAWTRDGLLRHASFKALRADKPALRVGHPQVD